MHTKQEPIRVGDRFEDTGSHVWKVKATRPGGIVQLLDEERARLSESYTRQVRLMTRLPRN